MITQIIKEKCKRKTQEVMQSALTGAIVFPWEVKLSKEYLKNDLKVWASEVNELQIIDKANVGIGPSVQYVIIKNRLYGEQAFPKKIIFESREDFLYFTSLAEEWMLLKSMGQKITDKLPLLTQWLSKNTTHKRILENYNKWDNLIEVCIYFLTREQYDLHVREIQLQAHTKFIEDNQTILYELLEEILSNEYKVLDSKDFFERYKIKTAELRVRIKILDENLQNIIFGLVGLTDLELIASEFDRVMSRFTNPIKFIVVENLTTFYTFPKIQSTIIILGKGYFAHTFNFKCFQKAELYYWGDLDVHGFEILAGFRRKYTQTESILMSVKTLQDHKKYWTTGKPSELSILPLELNDQERELYRLLKTRNLRLEQERISSQYIKSELEKIIIFNCL